MTGDEVALDRYSKFRKLGMFEEFLVTGGKNKEARELLGKSERVCARVVCACTPEVELSAERCVCSWA